MITTKQVQKEVTIADQVICNKCGQVITSNLLDPEHATLSADWGYGSQKDMEWHLAHICEPCYDELIKSFVIPPSIEK